MNTTTSTHFVPQRRFEIYEPLNQIGMWEESFKNNGGGMYTPNSIIIPTNEKPDSLSEDTSHGTEGTPHKFDQEASTSRHPDKIQRRLAQNREAARKSRLRKKAYVQQLETSRLKLIHLEQELDRARQQGFYVGNGVDTNNALGFSDNMSSERFFLWIGGFRPSELLKVLLPHFDPLTDQQLLDVCNLRQSCQQAEDAVSQGMEKLQHTLADTVAAGKLGEGSYVPQITCAMERLEALVSFVNQADHLRHETLQQMHRILTTRQAARGLLALGEYFQRLRALSSSWATRQREPT
ncbi:unnamed protein product [Thlaspi arvense]|uniref:Uncharacterized protein n=1 Tax=Thlaspi arvense TaxID=13288 RepID=A0AAU9SVJ5_THLAR|nr:unnamed protein product [Thlaspi arvense]